jgi:hypothetical protein
MHFVRYWGVLAPNARFRKQVIPEFTRAELKQKEKDKQNVSNETPSLFKKSSWAKLLARVFQIDISKCRDCDGEMKIISSIKDSVVIQKILNTLWTISYSYSHSSSSLSSTTQRSFDDRINIKKTAVFFAKE